MNRRDFLKAAAAIVGAAALPAKAIAEGAEAAPLALDLASGKDTWTLSWYTKVARRGAIYFTNPVRLEPGMVVAVSHHPDGWVRIAMTIRSDGLEQAQERATQALIHHRLKGTESVSHVQLEGAIQNRGYYVGGLPYREQVPTIIARGTDRPTHLAGVGYNPERLSAENLAQMTAGRPAHALRYPKALNRKRAHAWDNPHGPARSPNQRGRIT